MHPSPTPCVLTAERHRGGVLITFDNRRAALYSAALLYSVFDQASELPDSFAIAPTATQVAS